MSLGKFEDRAVKVLKYLEPMNPTDLAEIMDDRYGFSRSESQDKIWEMVDNGTIDITASLRIELCD
jgi:hypothetical protein